MPDSITVKLYFKTALDLASSQGAGWTRYSLSLNSPYDPDKSSITNTSAFGYYEWSQLYREYQCLSSSIHIRFINHDPDGYTRCAVVPETSNVYATDFRDVSYNRDARIALLLGTDNGSGTSRSVKHYMTMYKLFGAKKSQMVDDFRTCGTSTASPQKQAYWNIYCCDFDGNTSHPVDVRALVTICYYVRFYNRSVDLVNTTPANHDTPPSGSDEGIALG